jgi:hypothetical protein
MIFADYYLIICHQFLNSVELICVYLCPSVVRFFTTRLHRFSQIIFRISKDAGIELFNHEIICAHLWYVFSPQDYTDFHRLFLLHRKH